VTTDATKKGFAIIDSIFDELGAEKRERPVWPTDIVHAVALVGQSAGSAMQAALNCKYAHGELAHLRQKLARTAALCVRTMSNLHPELTKQERAIAGNAIVDKIFNELSKAEIKHPDWPRDTIHAVAIMVEEAGESIEAALDIAYADGGFDHLEQELSQTAAMCFRAMVNL
jgi:tellurite resistance protein